MIISNYVEEEVHYDGNVRSIGKGLIRTRSVSLTIVQACLHKMLLWIHLFVLSASAFVTTDISAYKIIGPPSLLLYCIFLYMFIAVRFYVLLHLPVELKHCKDPDPNQKKIAAIIFYFLFLYV